MARKIMLEGHFVATKSRRTIPLCHSHLSAGEPELVGDDYELLDLNDLITQGREGMVSYTVTGDSMLDEIKPGYKVIVDPFREPRAGNVIVARVNGKNSVKVFQPRAGGLYLISKNKTYPPRKITPKDDFQILGVVVAHIGIHFK